jgi:hypothetical protein
MKDKNIPGTVIKTEKRGIYYRNGSSSAFSNRRFACDFGILDWEISKLPLIQNLFKVLEPCLTWENFVRKRF